MVSDHTKDRVLEIIAVTELSLVLLGFLYYYTVQLPEQQRGLCKTSAGVESR